MAEDKKSFLLYCDLVHTIELLSDEQAGKVFKHLLAYVNDEQPTLDDPLLKIAFEPIKRQLKRDLEKYEGTKQERSIQGRKGNLKRWNRDLYDRLENGELSLEEAEEIANHRKVSPPDSTQSPPFANIAVNDNDTVNVNDNDINNNKPLPEPKDKIDFKILLDYINKKTGRKYRVINNKVKTKYRARLKDGYTKQDILNAINNALEMQTHIESGYTYLTPEFFSRSETLDKYGTEIIKQPKKNAYDI